MVYLKQLEVENFKSWRGRQVIGPFKRFNCIVGTNGSGKSNVMDALCFALGERAGCLRVKHARDLVHGAHIGVPVPGAAGVAVTFCEVPGEEEEEEEEKTFSRTITGDTSEYRINGTLVALSRYTSELQRLGIIVKARNCFVFQGAVESIAMMKPRERTQLFERISSSADLAEEYEAKKRATQKAEENAQFLYNRKKVVSVEQKEAKLEQVEAQKYQALAAAHERDTLQLHLCRLYYNGRSADGLSAALREGCPGQEPPAPTARHRRGVPRHRRRRPDQCFPAASCRKGAVGGRAFAPGAQLRLRLSRQFGRLFDLCHPIHKKYQLAVTKLFGKYLSAIVVTTERVAVHSFLFPRLDAGRGERPPPIIPSSFPPAQVRPLNERLREVKGAKMAVDVVQSASPPLKRAVQFVCGNGLVCETLKEARQIAFGGPERLKTVALDGTLFLKSGVISGGSSDLRSRARCWDEKEMDVLKEQRDRLTRELQIEDAVFLDFCIEIGVANIREYEDEHIKQQQETDKKRLQFETQKTRLGTQLDYELEQLQKQRKKIQELEETIDQEERRIAEQKKVEDDLLRAVDEATAALLDLKNRLAAKTAEVNSAKEEAERRVKGLQEVSRQLGRMQKEVLSLETSVEQKKMERHNILLSCKILGLPIPFLSGSLDDISEVQLDSEMESGLEDGKEIQAQLERLEQAARAQEDVLKRSTAPNLKVLEKMCRVQEKFQEVAHEFEASRRAANKARLEFEQVKARRYQLFSQCFEHVCVAIDQIYKRLCRNTSAQAFLSPENPEEPYLEGINYNCVSPGKRFMPMDNLSGGEKSIAALALVFAVNSYRPAPFFVMDEVDAALDNTNIGKVTSYIREQSREDFQMIVISLKEEFYSQADSLLGVYPEFDGGMCSHILSLDLTPFPLT
nr:PREDICTED: structural maintenance of chromosomes protein 1B [Lepisosteus oculatus]